MSALVDAQVRPPNMVIENALIVSVTKKSMVGRIVTCCGKGTQTAFCKSVFSTVFMKYNLLKCNHNAS